MDDQGRPLRVKSMKTWVAVAICAIGIACVILTLGSRNGPPRSLKEEFDERADRWVASCELYRNMSIRDPYVRNEEFRNLVELGPDIIPFVFERWYRLPNTKHERLMNMDDYCMYVLIESLTGVSLPADMAPMKAHIFDHGVTSKWHHDPYREVWWEWYQTTRKD